LRYAVAQFSDGLPIRLALTKTALHHAAHGIQGHCHEMQSHVPINGSLQDTAGQPYDPSETNKPLCDGLSRKDSPIYIQHFSVISPFSEV